MKIKTSKVPIYIVQEEGLVANRDYAEGRFLPAIVVSSDTDNYLKEIIEIHNSIPSGDIEIQWAGLIEPFFNINKWILNIKFNIPIKYEMNIVFSLKDHYHLIDAILQSKGLLISYGSKGDKVSSIKKRISLEIPMTGVAAKWENLLKKIIRKIYQKHRIPKSDLNRCIEEHIKAMREFTNTQFKPLH